MKILILGGNGFIGSHIVDLLLAEGHEVRIFDRSSDPWRKPLAGVSYFYGDFSHTTVLAEALQGADAVIHAISTTVPSTSNLEPIADVESNLQNTLRLLQLMVSAQVSRVIFLSSGGTVYGVPKCMPVPEEHPLDPICSYGVVKVAIEKYLGMFECLYGIKPLVLRASNPYGPRQGHRGVQGVIGTFMQKIVSGEGVSIWGDGSVKRDYLYITDLARLCVDAVNSNVCGVFNAGSGIGYTLNELVAMMEDAVGIKAKVQFFPERSFDVKEIVLDVQKAKVQFGWQPQVAIDEGIDSQYAWLKQIM